MRQQERIEQLERRMSELDDKLKKLEGKPSYTIESIEYHFDQLKVEKLEGTLNIGMTAPGIGDGKGGGNGDIEQLSVGDALHYPSASPGMTPPPDPYNDIWRRLNGYLNTEAMERLLAIEHELGLPLDARHRQIIIEDVRKQLPARIHYYMQQMLKSDGQNLSVFPDLMATTVYEKTKRDAEAALGTYMRQMKAGYSGSGGIGP